MVNNNIQHCTCSNSSGSIMEFNDLGAWLVCSDCKKAIKNSFEFFDRDDKADQQFAGVIFD
jgi:hypothetical protein